MPSSTTTTTVKVISKDVIRVEFEDGISATSSVSDSSTYVITPHDSSSNLVEILSVITNVEEGEALFYIDLNITAPTIGALYAIEIDGLYDLTGNDYAVLGADFVGKSTKIDSMTNSFGRMYDLKIGSNLRNILMAVCLEDEKIGGQGDLSARPPSSTSTTTSTSTYGTATYGTNTYGG